MYSSGRRRNDIRLRLRRTNPGVKRMAEDSPAPPLTRRGPGATRGGPGSLARPVLSEALLERMQAAGDAARADQGAQADRAAFSKVGGAGRQLPVQLWPPVEARPVLTPPPAQVPLQAQAPSQALAPPPAQVPLQAQAPSQAQ